MKKFIIITSIFEPTIAIKKFALQKDWHLIVVGDKKTPTDWKHNNVTYLSPKKQQKLGYQISEHLPWNHYCRKMIGYLYAIQQGAEVIADSDDDNIPLKSWGKIDFNDDLPHVSTKDDFINPYRHFTDKFIWPRGLPLEQITTSMQHKIEYTKSKKTKIGVWQYLADNDPDVDAVYRLTNNSLVKFEDKNSIIIKQNIFAPYNSQNTFHNQELFPLLYLPAFVTFRLTDILRGICAQPIMWRHGYHLAFGKATVKQERNEHNFLKDFESEIPMYLNIYEIAQTCLNLPNKNKSVASGLVDSYKALLKLGFVEEDEVALVKAWVSDLQKIGLRM